MTSKYRRLLQATLKTLTRSSLRENIENARALHVQGDHAQAFRQYSSLVELHADNAEIHYRFGNLRKDQGDLDRALDLYDRAIALEPTYAHAHCNRAVVLGLLNRQLEALESYDRTIELDPRDSIAHCNRAVLLLGLNMKEAALASFEIALSRDPSNFQAHFGRATVLQERKLWANSLAAYDRAIAINPNDAPAHYNRGTVAAELQQWHEALPALERAIALNPDLAHAFAKRGEVLQELQQYAAALASYDRAIELNDGDANYFNNRGVLSQSMGQFKAALADYDRALSLNPNYADVCFNRGSVLQHLDQLTAALASYDLAIALRPRYDVAYVNRGTVLQELGLIKEALLSYEQAIALKPDLPEAHYNLALASLAEGDYATGWSEYEWRWRAKGGPIYREKRSFSQPLWLGADSIEAKTILLYGEQGLGDSLQFFRYVELVVKLGARVIVEVPAPLVMLFSSLSGVAQVVAYGDSLPLFDFQCPLMSLALVFKTTLQTIPFSDGYLKSNQDKVSIWQGRLGAKTKPRIGLTWSGNQALGTNRKRHYALAKLIPFLSDEMEYFCLQTDVVASDQETLASSSKVRQYPGLLRDFSDTAALCACMDLVISVDTSVAHLAGALGKRTWVALAFVADWRWLRDRDDSPWYRSLRLFRQKSDGAWEDVFERIATDLRLAGL